MGFADRQADHPDAAGGDGEGAAAAQARLGRQRQAFAALESGAAKENFRLAVLSRAEELLQVNPEAADALLEFLPEEDRERLLAGFFDD
jgi:hypothetical protein